MLNVALQSSAKRQSKQEPRANGAAGLRVGLGTPQRVLLMKWVQEAGFIEADECRYKP